MWLRKKLTIRRIPSPNLAPCDNFLFPNLKKTLKATKFRDDDELRAAVERHFVDKPNEYFYNNNNNNNICLVQKIIIQRYCTGQVEHCHVLYIHNTYINT
jgi:hypothetical protein